jgi:NAD(P)-dependent dehydrogenase (short-subunit alcohol dehydrogenase family)
MNLLITGSSSGIGLSVAEHLLAQGHQVWGWARSDQDQLVNRGSGRFRCSRCDVQDWEQVKRAADEMARVWAHLDGLVTCAGVQGEIGRTLASDPVKWGATVRINLDGTYHAIRACHDLLAKAPHRAKVVCFSGGGATKARPRFSAYGSAKTAVVRLVETIAEEEKGTRLDINAVAPGIIPTRLTDEVLALGPEVAGQQEYETARRQNRDGEAMGKAVGLVSWLLSPASDGVSGRLISAPWDPWATLDRHTAALANSDIYTLRRITPEERGQSFGQT